MSRVIVILFTVLVLLNFGCKSNTVYVPVETVKTEYQERLVRDSIYLQDSIFVSMKGDTVWYEKYKYLYRDKLVRDSIFICDSIQVPYPVIEIKEVNRLMKWQVVLMCLGCVTIGFVGWKVWRIGR